MRISRYRSLVMTIPDRPFNIWVVLNAKNLRGMEGDRTNMCGALGPPLGANAGPLEERKCRIRLTFKIFHFVLLVHQK